MVKRETVLLHIGLRINSVFLLDLFQIQQLKMVYMTIQLVMLAELASSAED